MAVLPILFYPDPRLKKKAEEIKNPKNPAVRELVFDMLETMKKNNGLGLAAPQVGKLLRLCVIKFEKKTYILINPKIKSKSWSKEIAEEGCLSFPGQFIPVKRSKRVKVAAQDKTGKKISISAEGLLARAFQHEIDHLDGILYIDRV
ncbi:MAG TPA: peptide deformylase [Candidatus Moranbacteria bacterium]|nr:peptide deformylase [Candidatus Moranbacteria bacterium]HAT74563.1 peptide deformylase [Candidatus Moranbacteria bacterium]